MVKRYLKDQNSKDARCFHLIEKIAIILILAFKNALFQLLILFRFDRVTDH